jgi:hypothetical protein
LGAGEFSARAAEGQGSNWEELALEMMDTEKMFYKWFRQARASRLLP